MRTIGQTLLKLREEAGVSGNKIAKAANISVTTYYKIERGNRDVSFIVLFRICRFYEISLQEFADIINPLELERKEISSLRAIKKREERENN